MRGFRTPMLLGLVLVLGSSVPAGAGRTPPLTPVQQEVEQAAKRYLDAEVRRDLQAVYSNLYPASEYCRINDYAAYLKEAQASPVRIAAYEILHIRIAPENPDKEKYPNLEGFARVEVDVTLRYQDSGQKSLVNYDFPFVKEGGRWYKL